MKRTIRSKNLSMAVANEPQEQNQDLKQVQEEPTPISHHWSDSPVELENLILKCLAKNPKDRPQTVQTVLNELLTIEFSWAKNLIYL